ncbi:MAG TPA: sugar ABC transporter permease [Devosia sp.]|nr:sugar ABC transporter permease [Devosia sp.]
MRAIHFLLLSPVLGLATIFLAGPALYVLWLSLTVSNYGMNAQFVGLQNYVTVLQDPGFWTAVVNTLIIVNVVVYVELILALGISLVVQRQSGLMRVLLFSAILVPYGISDVVGVMAWRFMSDPNFGILARGLASIGIDFNWTINPTLALILVTIISVWHHLPFTFVLVFAALVSVPKDMVEAAEVDGAGPFQRFWYIIFPFIVPAVLLAMLFRYVFGLRLFTEVWLLTNGGPMGMTEVLGTYLYKNAFRFGDFGAASATGWMMVVITLLLASPYLVKMYKGTFRDV